MSEYVHLIGADDVRAAGRTISSAADTMRSAAASIDESLQRHRQAMDEWLFRFEQLLDQFATTIAPPVQTGRLGTGFSSEEPTSGEGSPHGS